MNAALVGLSLAVLFGSGLGSPHLGSTLALRLALSAMGVLALVVVAGVLWLVFR